MKMKMNDIKGRMVKIGKTSITVKDEENKTRGIVRNIQKFKDTSTKDAMKYWKVLKEVGIWGKPKFTENVLIHDGNMYLLKDAGAISRRLDLMEKVDWVRAEDYSKYEAEMELYKTAEEHGIIVIECNFV